MKKIQKENFRRIDVMVFISNVDRYMLFFAGLNTANNIILLLYSDVASNDDDNNNIHNKIGMYYVCVCIFIASGFSSGHFCAQTDVGWFFFWNL